MNYSDSHKLAWFAPIRTASRATSRVLQHFGFTVNPHTHNFNVVAGKEDYTLLVNVRNPFARAVSIWKWMITTKQVSPDFTFTEWVEKNLTRPNVTYQYERNLTGRTYRLIRCEELATDLKAVPVIRDGWDNTQVQKDIAHHIHRNPYLSDSVPYQAAYDQRLVDVVGNYFKDQFQLFGYATNL